MGTERYLASPHPPRPLNPPATLHELFLAGKIGRSILEKAITELGLDPETLNPVIS